MVKEVLTAVVTTILPIFLGYLATLAKRFVEQDKVQKELKDKAFYVELGVKAVEQLYHDYEGDYRLEKAKTYIRGQLANLGVSISEEELSMMIEANVLRLKAEFGEGTSAQNS